MIAPLAWLTLRGARNRLARRLRRIRQPRYAAAMAVGAAYLWLVLLRPGRPAPLAIGPAGGFTHLAYALGIALLVASWWLVTTERAPLEFSPAEVQLLFPAPLARRELVLFKLMQGQLLILASTVIWTLLLGRPTGSPWMRAIALWVLFSTLHLHRIGASLVRYSATHHGTAGVRHHRWAIGLFAGMVGVMAWTVIPALPELWHAARLGGGAWLPATLELFHRPAMRVVLAPFRILLAPVFAASPAEWGRSILPALALLAVHYPWVLRTDAAFEEAAADAAARRANAAAAHPSPRARARIAPRRHALARLALPLASTGHPATAILWKNALALARTLPLGAVTSLAVMAVLVLLLTTTTAPGTWSAGHLMALASLTVAALLLAMGPRWVRNDLRLDLLRLEALRTYPLSGAAIVRAEIGAPAAILTVLELALVAIALVTLPTRGELHLARSDRAALLVAATLALPAVNAAGITIQNAAALLFPAWVRLGLTRTGGVEALGQGIITALGSLLALLALLIVPLAAAAVPALVGIARTGIWALVPGALVGAATLLAELWLITARLGRMLERTEPLEPELAPD
jgi:ABC-2 type transport system permease protein